jgi:hypothetical protein
MDYQLALSNGCGDYLLAFFELLRLTLLESTCKLRDYPLA